MRTGRLMPAKLKKSKFGRFCFFLHIFAASTLGMPGLSGAEEGNITFVADGQSAVADPVVHSDTDGKVAILRNQIRDLNFKREKTTLMCHNQFPIDINFCNMGHGVKTQYLTLSVASAQSAGSSTVRS